MTKIVLCIGFILCTTFSNVQAQKYNFQYLTIQKGLPQSQVFTICFDNKDYAWIGTQGGGVAIYNGIEYTYLTTEDSLISNRIYDIVNIDNYMWIACKGGVSKFDSSGVFIQNYRFKNSSRLAKKIIKYQSKIWVATNQSVCFIDRNKLVNYDDNIVLKNIGVTNFFINQNELWIVTSTGIYSLTNPLNKLNTNRGLRSNYATTIATYKNQWVIGMYGGGVQLYDRVRGIYMPKELDVLKKKIILNVLVNTNEVWISTMNSGVYVWNPKTKQLKQFSVKNGLSNNHVRVALKDKWGNIWIGTSGGGISIYNNSPFLEYNKTNGLNSNYIYAIVKDLKNNLWVSTEGTGVVRLNDSSVTLFDEENGFKSVKTRVLFKDKNQNIWFGSQGQGVGIWLANDTKDTIYSFKSRRGLSNGWIKSIVQHPKTNEIFLGTSGGIFVVKNYSNFPDIKFEKIKNKKIPNRITQLAFSEKGILYYASIDGIGEIKVSQKPSNKWEVSLINKQPISFRNICVKDSFIYAGSTDKGVLKVNINQKNKTHWINTKNWLNSNNIYQLTWHKNYLWVGTEKGLVRISFTNTKIVSTKIYKYEDGFEGVETNINASFVDDDNFIWFGTTNGLFLYTETESNKEKLRQPSFRFTDIQLYYESILKTPFARFFNHPNKDSILVLPYHQNHIGFNLEAIHYGYTHQIKYRWKLEGLDKNWTPPTKNTTATFGNLPAGDYVFKAQVSIDDSWNNSPITYHFKIEAALWDTLWFKILMLIGMLLTVAGIVYLIYRRFKLKNKALRDKLDMERSLLELEQKALRLQMNPHFIFNALNSIHNLIILNDSSKARYALAKFSKLMRRILENSREKLISIDDEIETLENYVQLEKLTTQVEFEFKIDIDETIDTNEPILPPLMIQPFIENAIIHGLKNIMHEGVISVDFKLLNDHLLQCTINDNGIGRVNAGRITAQKESYHKSTALHVTQERLSNINSKPNFVPFQIIDKVDEKGCSTGTKIVIQLEI